MKRAELIKTLQSRAGSDFITRKQISEAIGYRDPASVDPMLNGLDRLNGKYYFIPDVAERMLQRVSAGGEQ